MAEDFVGVSGSLNESFVGAANDKLFEVPFEALEVRMAKEKPQVMPCGRQLMLRLYHTYIKIWKTLRAK